MPKAFSEHEKEVIQQRLMAAGEQQFASYGFKKTNVEELAQAAGISKGAFYLFYPSKESLYMDVIENAETHFRHRLLDAVEQSGPSPRARLYHVLEQAFLLWKEIPVLRLFTSGDFYSLMHATPPEQIQQHMTSDLVFMRELVARCRQQGIPLQVEAEELSRMVYALLFAHLHEDFYDADGKHGTFNTLLELAVAYLLGETPLQLTGQYNSQPFSHAE